MNDDTKLAKEYHELIEVNMTFDIKPNANWNSFEKWEKGTIKIIDEIPGCKRTFVSRNIVKSPYIKWTLWWETLDNWQNFTTNDTWVTIISSIQTDHGKDLNYELWKLDPLVALPGKPKSKGVTEVNLTGNLLPSTKWLDYGRLANQTIREIFEDPGCAIAFASRNVWGSPAVQWTIWWQQFKDWAAFLQNTKWVAIVDDLRSKITAINVEIWSPPVLHKDKQTEEPPKPG
ncbi:MAG: hypothetical protein WBE28_01305 [bacterium]